MKSQLFVFFNDTSASIKHFQVEQWQTHIRLSGCVIGKWSFTQVVEVHIFLDRIVFKGLHTEVVNNIINSIIL